MVWYIANRETFGILSELGTTSENNNTNVYFCIMINL